MSETLAGMGSDRDLRRARVGGGTRAFVRFGDEGRTSGNSGCNRFTGSYKIDGATLLIGPGIAMTRGVRPPAIIEEARLVRALDAARGFFQDGIALDLTGEDGASVLRMRRTDWY